MFNGPDFENGPDVMRCPRCMGRGEFLLDCSLCCGAGEIETAVYESYTQQFQPEPGEDNGQNW